MTRRMVPYNPAVHAGHTIYQVISTRLPYAFGMGLSPLLDSVEIAVANAHPAFYLVDLSENVEPALAVSEKAIRDLRLWAKKATKDARGGRSPAAEFVSDEIPPALRGRVAALLPAARTAEEVKAIFQPLIDPAGAKQLRFTPDGSDEPLNAVPEEPEISHNDVERALTLFDEAFPEFSGMLGRAEDGDAPDEGAGDDRG
jgi:hypothetical protein